jgi:hypothetical protein
MLFPVPEEDRAEVKSWIAVETHSYTERTGLPGALVR